MPALETVSLFLQENSSFYPRFSFQRACTVPGVKQAVLGKLFLKAVKSGRIILKVCQYKA